MENKKRNEHKADSNSTNLMSARQTVLFPIFNLTHNEQKITKSTLSQTYTMRGAERTVDSSKMASIEKRKLTT